MDPGMDHEAMSAMVEKLDIIKPMTTYRRTVPLASLKVMPLKRLVQGRSGEGKVLIGCIVDHPGNTDEGYGMASCIFQDESGLKKRLVVSAAVRVGAAGQAKLCFPIGVRLAVKEPAYCPTFERVFAFFNGIEYLGVAGLSSASSSAELRAIGNKHFREGSLVMAAMYYKEALARMNKNDDNKEAVLVYSNRALVNLKLLKLDDALADANAALSFDRFHVKSLFRKALALSAVQEHQQAAACAELALEHATDEEDRSAARKIIAKFKSLAEQAKMGLFDASAFLRSFSQKDLPEEFSDYVGPLEIKMVSGKGRGVFVTRDVKLGEVLAVCNPIGFATKSSRGLDLTRNKKVSLDVITDATARCLGSSRLSTQLYALLGSGRDMNAVATDMDIYRADVGDKQQQPPPPALDMNPLKKNACTYVIRLNSIHPADPEYEGLWGLPCLINHSCLGNVSWLLLGRALVVRASSDINAGEEVLHPYWEIIENKSFVCRCRKCVLKERFPSVQSFIDVEESCDLSEAEKSLVRGIFYYYYVGLPGLALYRKLELISAVMSGTGISLILMSVACNANRGEMSPRVRELLKKEVIGLFGEQEPDVMDAVLDLIVTRPELAAAGTCGGFNDSARRYLQNARLLVEGIASCC